MRHILVIGEKTSQVKKFASVLCGSFKSTKHGKYVFTYTGTWKGAPQPTNFTFLPLVGHISTIDTAKGYGWGECAPISIVADPQALEVKHTRKYVTILRKEIKGKNELWLALDPDSEGDNIALEVVTILKNQIKSTPVRRIWNASLTDKEIKRAFLNPKPWNDLLGLGVQGRRIIDAWLGFAGTREITRAARKVAKIKVLSVGRVQLPTLFLIVQADLAHETFVIEDRFKLVADLETPEGEYKATHHLGLVADRTIYDKLIPQLANKAARILDIESNQQKIPPPFPHNTTAAVSLLSRVMKVKADTALSYMVELYNKGLLSYPRTENKKFADGFPHREIISKLAARPDLVPFIAAIKQTNQVRRNGPRKGVEEDHDPIHPTGELKELANVDAAHKKAWDILTRYYLSLFMEDHLIDQVNVTTMIDTEKFLTEGRTVSQDGWKEIQWWSSTKTTDLPHLTTTTPVVQNNLSIEQSKTKPPPRVRDSQLLLDMEKANIGTKSSRPDIIKKIEQRNYVQRHKQQLISTAWGRTLIASLAPIWPEVIRPQFTSHVEDLMDKVATGKKPYSAMIDQLRKEYLSLHKELFPKLSQYRKLLQSLNLDDQSKKTKQDTTNINQILQLTLNPTP